MGLPSEIWPSICVSDLSGGAAHIEGAAVDTGEVDALGGPCGRCTRLDDHGRVVVGGGVLVVGTRDEGEGEDGEDEEAAHGLPGKYSEARRSGMSADPSWFLRSW
jgi:hypothetical protein